MIQQLIDIWYYFTIIVDIYWTIVWKLIYFSIMKFNQKEKYNKTISWRDRSKKEKHLENKLVWSTNTSCNMYSMNLSFLFYISLFIFLSQLIIYDTRRKKWRLKIVAVIDWFSYGCGSWCDVLHNFSNVLLYDGTMPMQWMFSWLLLLITKCVSCCRKLLIELFLRWKNVNGLDR